MFRIAELRRAKGLNMSDAAKMLGMPYTTYVNYEKGLREPTSEILIQLADFYDTTIDYMIGRPGASAKNACHSIVEKSAAFQATAEEKQIILKYRQLDERGRSAVVNTLEHEYSTRTEKNTIPTAKEA